MFGSIRAATLTAAMLAAITAAPLAAQSFWLGPVAGNGVTIEVVRPELKQYDVTAASLAYYLSMRLAATSTLRVVGEVPFSHVGFDMGANEPDGGGTMIGNPYVGAEWTPAGSMFTVEGGMRLPLAEHNNWRVFGMYSDIDRVDAFTDVTSITARGNLLWQVPDTHWALRLGAGPSVWIDSGETDTDTDLMIGYGGQIWYRARALDVGTGFTGLVRQSGDGTLAERSWHQVGLMANLVYGSVQPGLLVRLPIGENMNDVMDYAIALHVTVSGVR